MTQIQYLEIENRPSLAYIHSLSKNEDLPAIVFLGGFKSDMEGTKARYLEEKCCERGHEFLRFDYSGHGISKGNFVDGTIGSWLADAQNMIDQIVKCKKIILVGSSMGGWIALKLLLQNQEKIKGVVGIAAAPDFTRDIKAQMTPDQYDILEKTGRLEEANEYSDEPYIFTKALLDDGEQQSLLHDTYNTATPITLIQGKLDADVPWEKAERIKTCFGPSNVEIVYIEDGGHSLSRGEDLAIIDTKVKAMALR
ncbi:MAG: alpha/beta hydrolase [Alphaproteobacteria bacterium]|nr:alpha/beta hydrolase [Alphaproteobacteria bacterium]